jgi:dolichyl-phosphate-mannose--protein O-mannosyl transferase
VGPAGQDARVLMAIGNPLLWWAAVPAALAALVRGLRGDGRALFVALGFVTTWGVWAVGPLELVFIHYFADSIVWACLALGLWLDLGLDTRARGFCLVYLALVALAFLHFYPLVTATPIPGQWFGARLWGGIYPWRWLPSWY